MSTLLLQLVAPLQSWGVQSRFTVRDTGLEPSKSGVIGLLCAALGRPRDAALDDLAALRMAVRVDREGRMAMDYHTAQNVYVASGSKPRNVVSQRYYLADAAFLAGLEGDLALLRGLHQALRNPVWPLYLGRKAFVPAAPVWLPDGLREDEALPAALAAYPWLGRGRPPERLRAVWDDRAGDEIRPDVPLSFARRRFAQRRVRTTFIDAPPISEEVS